MIDFNNQAKTEISNFNLRPHNKRFSKLIILAIKKCALFIDSILHIDDKINNISSEKGKNFYKKSKEFFYKFLERVINFIITLLTCDVFKMIINVALTAAGIANPLLVFITLVVLELGIEYSFEYIIDAICTSMNLDENLNEIKTPNVVSNETGKQEELSTLENGKTLKEIHNTVQQLVDVHKQEISSLNQRLDEKDAIIKVLVEKINIKDQQLEININKNRVLQEKVNLLDNTATNKGPNRSTP